MSFLVKENVVKNPALISKFLIRTAKPFHCERRSEPTSGTYVYRIDNDDDESYKKYDKLHQTHSKYFLLFSF